MKYREKIEHLQSEVDSARGENADLKKAELKLRQEQESLLRDRQDFELEKQRAIDAARKSIYKDAEERAAERYELQLRDKEEQLQRVRRDLEEM